VINAPPPATLGRLINPAATRHLDRLINAAPPSAEPGGTSQPR
jgi:hypothetical protein